MPINVGSRDLQQVLAAESYAAAMEPPPAAKTTYGATTDTSVRNPARICSLAREALAHCMIIDNYSNYSACSPSQMFFAAHFMGSTKHFNRVFTSKL